LTVGGDESYDPSNLSTIAFVCDRDSYEIFQSVSADLD
jgi:hypothetical protein